MRIPTNLAAFYFYYLRENSANQPERSDAKPKTLENIRRKLRKRSNQLKKLALAMFILFIEILKSQMILICLKISFRMQPFMFLRYLIENYAKNFLFPLA